LKISELKAKVKALQIIHRKQLELAYQANMLRMKIELEMAHREAKQQKEGER
jgi:hypothetical protein